MQFDAAPTSARAVGDSDCCSSDTMSAKLADTWVDEADGKSPKVPYFVGDDADILM
jgi:hypothetical protein